MTGAAAPLVLGGSPRTAPHLPTAKPTQSQRLTPTPDTLTSHFTHHTTLPARDVSWLIDLASMRADLRRRLRSHLRRAGHRDRRGVRRVGPGSSAQRHSRRRHLLTGPSRWAATHPRSPNPATGPGCLRSLSSSSTPSTSATFDLGDDWTHLCSCSWAPSRWRRCPTGVGEIPDQYRGRGCRVCWTCYLRMLTARAMTKARVASEIRDCPSMVNLAHRDSGMTSVGLKAVALVNER